MSSYFALIEERNGEKSFIMTDSASLEENQGQFGGDSMVRAVYRVELEENQRIMLETLLKIDSATNTNLVEDLMASLLTAGYRFGR